MRARIDWKYALGLELTDAGFDFSVLSEFRARLVDGGAAQVLLDALLARCKERGYLKARGQQRTDATHVLGALRVLSRLECVSETLRAALNAIAAAAPDWLRLQVPADWLERYGRRIEEYRLPKGKAARQAYGETVGGDGIALLTALFVPTAPAALRLLPAVALLRRTWIAQYVVQDGRVHLRDAKQMPVAALRIDTPHEPEARYSEKRGMGWTGYKVHLTETCDDDSPHLLTQVETTVATETDVVHLAVIHAGLARTGLLPARHFVDVGYIRARNLVESRIEHGIDLFGPTYEDRQWQARGTTWPLPDRLGRCGGGLSAREAECALEPDADGARPGDDPCRFRGRRLSGVSGARAMYTGEATAAQPDAPLAGGARGDAGGAATAGDGGVRG